MALPPPVAATRHAVRGALRDLPADALVLVGCSGGADSLALAAATAFEAPRAGRRVGAITVDHGLQSGSAQRAAGVAATLRGLGLAPVEVATVEVAGPGGPEAAAREARYAALEGAATRLGAAAVLLGHTLDDQAETVLMRLARGSGARSLAAMAPVSGLYRRPFLELTHATTRAACLAAGLRPWDDPHNLDASFTRVRVRTRALPALREALGPGVDAALGRTARLLRDDADALDEWAQKVAARATRASEATRAAESIWALGPTASGPTVELDIAVLEAVPAAVRRRVLHRAALAAGAPAGTLAAVHVEALDVLITGWRGQRGVDLPGGLRAVRRHGGLVLGAVAEPDRHAAERVGEPASERR